MKKRSNVLMLGLIGASMLLGACSGGSPETSSRSSGGGERAREIRVSDYGELANGQFDFSEESWQEKSKILAALEKYSLDNHTAGIPLYDDASYEQFSQRAFNGLPSKKYLTNYGFGVGYGDFHGSQMMNTGEIDEPNPDWKDYFHGYTSTDSGTFNGWNATGSDVSDRMGMISSNYFGVKANADNTAYSWIGSLSIDDAPIMLSDWDNPTVVEDPGEEDTSQYWRVRVHFGEGYTYRTAATSKWKSKYDNREVALEDYLTPFRAMLDNKLVRASELISETSGFYGALDYYYLTQKTEDDFAKVGIRLNEDEGAIEFRFIQPQSTSRARTSLSSMLYSPVPAEFLTDIKGATNFGKISDDDGTHVRVFDNILCFGAYIPEYWELGKQIVYQANETYFEASDYHYAGYSEVVFEGEQGPDNAYTAFLNNKLDEVSIPVKQLDAHKNDPTVLRTEGSTIIKLNVNSTTEDEWEYYFGENGVISTHTKKAYWSTKALMSDPDFLDGVYFAINRKELADAAGRNPALGYLSQAYMLDPTGTHSYRASEYGQGVLESIIDDAGNEFGYSPSLAEAFFKSCARRLVANGVYDIGDHVKIRAVYRYQNTIDNLGSYIKNYIETTWNRACGDLFTIEYAMEVGGDSYTDTYTRMDHGEFDFAEGAISGNVLNPLEFMNTISTNKALNQGFNLNWGHRTDRIFAEGETVFADVYPCVYDGKCWSYDALWNASQGFIPVDDGLTTPVGSDPELSDEGDDVRYTAYFSENAVDPDTKKIVYSFSIKDFAIITSNMQDGFDGGIYYDVIFKDAPVNQGGNVSADAYFFIDVPKEAIERIAKQVAGDAKTTQQYFRFYFTIVYTVKLRNKTITKSLNVDIGGDLEDFGMEPQD